MKFGDILKKLRLGAGLTQIQMAEKLGISRSTVGMYEQGKREPDFELEEKIADLFNVSLDYLRTGDPSPKHGGWYLDDETAKVAQEVYDDKDLRLLFDAARGSRPENIRLAAEMLKRFKETNPDG